MTLKPIAYVQAAWHTDITDHCRTAFMAGVVKHGYGAGDVEFFSVPGSLEIPLMARKLAQTGAATPPCAPAASWSTAGSTGTTSWRKPCCTESCRPRWRRMCRCCPPCSHASFPRALGYEEFFKQHMQTKGKELAEACVAIVGQLAAVA